MNAKDGVPLLGRPRGGVGGRSSLIDCSTAQILLDAAASHTIKLALSSSMMS